VALVYYFFDPHGITNDPHLSTVITTTLVVVLISILIFGAATKPLLAYLMGNEDAGGAEHGGWAALGRGATMAAGSDSLAECLCQPGSCTFNLPRDSTARARLS